VTGQLLVVVGAAIVAGWWILPLFAFGVDATLDPWRFTTFAIPRHRLLIGLAVAGLVSVPAAATLLVGLGTAFAWASDPLALLAALVGALAAVALCIVGSRATTTALAPFLDSRRRREVLMIAAVVPLLAIGPFIAWLSSASTDESTVTVSIGGDGLVDRLAPVAEVLSWTPFGAPWAFAASVHDGAWARLAIQVVVVAATMVLIAWVWDRAMARALVTPRGGGEVSKGRGLGWFGRVPATPTAAVAARCATYWLRDPRYAASLALVPLIPVVVAGVGVSSGGGSWLLLAVAPFAAFILGFSLSNDVGYDNTAFVLHVATGASGRADRWGRVVPVVILGVPLVAAMAVAAVGAAGRWADLPAVLGLSLGVLGAALGVSSVASARFVYPVPKPGESAFKSPQGATVATMLAQTVSFVVIVVLLVPLLAVALTALLAPNPALGWVALAVGLLTAVVVLAVGVRWGARVYERRLPDLLAQVTAFA
jgi:ABC-2 type transport system permease protein